MTNTEAEKTVLAAASCVTQKYFFENRFKGLPQDVQKELQILCVTLAEKLGCTFLIGFYDDGEVYFETVAAEDDLNFDEIGAELEIKELLRKQREFLRALELWYQLVILEMS
ncbi:MAG: DUF6145 family protein [Bacillota bacterium]